MSHGGGEGSMKVVVAALVGNLAIAACKFGAAYYSKSAAMLAEAVHSLSDTGNQALLLVGMRLALRPPSERHPFGRAGEQYFWPFIVSLLLFSIGGAFSISAGIHTIHDPGQGATGRQRPAADPGLGLFLIPLRRRRRTNGVLRPGVSDTLRK